MEASTIVKSRSRAVAAYLGSCRFFNDALLMDAAVEKSVALFPDRFIKVLVFSITNVSQIFKVRTSPIVPLDCSR